MKIFNVINLCLFIALFSCSKNNKLEQPGQLIFFDCMPDRKSTETLTGQEGTIRLIADKYIIETADGQSRLGPCNLPEAYLTDGLKVRYSIVLKEILPTERWMAAPSYLTNIDKLND